MDVVARIASGKVYKGMVISEEDGDASVADFYDSTKQRRHGLLVDTANHQTYSPFSMLVPEAATVILGVVVLVGTLRRLLADEEPPPAVGLDDEPTRFKSI